MVHTAESVPPDPYRAEEATLSSRSAAAEYHRPRRYLAAAAAAAAVLAATAALAKGSVPRWESSVFSALHDVPRAVDFVLWAPMQAGSAWAPPVAAAVGWWVARSWRPTAGTLVAGWVGWWLAKGVKSVVERGRPLAELGGDAVRDTALVEGLGFVSGHATVAFACVTVLAPYLRRRPWRWVAFALATCVALSRVVVGAHLPLDVVGGASLGVLLALVWHLAVGVPVRREAQ